MGERDGCKEINEGFRKVFSFYIQKNKKNMRLYLLDR